MESQPGQVIIELDSEINRVYFIVAGRLEGALFDRLGKKIHRDTFRRGSVVGLFSVLLPDRSHLHAEAAEPTTLIHLALDDLFRSTAKYREFQLTMFRIAANVVKHLSVTSNAEVRCCQVVQELASPQTTSLFRSSRSTLIR
jgi:CRP-like cAMP-binding protein